MKPWIFFSVSAALLSLVGFFVWSVMDVRSSSIGSSQIQWATVGARIETHSVVPDFQFLNKQRAPVRFYEIKKLKIVNFWASWCGPCIQEIPALANLAKIRAGDIEVIAISCDSKEKDFRKALSLFPNFTSGQIEIVFDPDKRVMNAYGVTGFPETFIVSADNRLIKKIIGPLEWDKLPTDFFEK